MYKYKVISQGYNTNNMNFNDIDTKRETAISKLTSADLKRFGLTEEQTNQIKSEWNKNSQDLLATIENISNELTTKAQNIKITSGKNGINIVDNKSMNDTETQINELKQTISKAYDELLDVFDVKNKEARTKTYDLSKLIVEKLNQLKVLDPKAINLENITEAYNRQINTEAILKKANVMISEPDLLEYEDTEDKIGQYNDLLGLLKDLKTAKGALSDKSFSKILSDNNINVTDINNKFKTLHEGFVQTNVDFNKLSGSATEFQTLIGEVFGNKYILPEFKGTGTGSGSGSGSGTGNGSGDSDFDNAEVEKLQQDYADLTAEVEKYKAQITETTAKLEEMKKTQAESEGDKSKIKELQASLDALNVSYAEAQNKMKEYRSELAAYESMSLVQDANGNNVNQEQYDKLISDAKQTATELENTRNQLKMLQEQAAAGGSDEYVVQLNNQLKSTEAMLNKVTNELEYMESSRNRWMDRAEMNAVIDESGQSVYQNDYDNIVAKLSEMKTEAQNAKDELEKLKATSVQLGEGEQVAKPSDIEAVKGLSEAVKSLQERMTKAEEILQEVPKGKDGLKKLSSQIQKMSGNFNEDGSIKSMGISAEALSEQLKNLEAEFDARIAKKIEEIEKKSYKENQPDKKLTLVGKIKGLKVITNSKPATEPTITKNDSAEKGINDYTKLITLVKQYNEIEAQHISTKNDKSVQIYQSKIDRLEKMKELIIQIRQETDNLNVSDEKIAEKLNKITLNDNSKSLAISDSKIFDTLLQMIETKIQNNQEVINKRQADLSKYDNYIKNFSSTINNFKKTFQSILSIKMTKKNTDDIYNQLNTLFEDITTNLNLYNKYTDHPSYSENFAKQMNTLQAQVDKVATAIYQADDIGGKKETFEKSKAEFLIGYKPPKKKTEQVISNEPTVEDLRLIEQETQDRNKNAQAIDNEAEALSRYQELKEKGNLTSAERVEYSNLRARMSREQESNIVSTGSSTSSKPSENSGNATPPDNTTLSAILTEVKSINRKMDTSATKASNNASPNISANQSPNNTPSSVTTPSISSEVQAASKAVTAEVQAFTTIDGAVTGLTGDINTKTEAIRAETQVMIEASKQETQAIGRIVSGVIKLKEEIKSIPKISVTGKNTKAEPIKNTAEISDEQIAKIRQRILDAFGEKNPIPIFFKPNVQSIKKQINDGLKDGLEKLTIQSFDVTTAAESVKETLSKVLDGVGLKFDTEKLENEVREAVNSGVEAASAEQNPETSDNKAVRFKERATNDIGKLRDKYADKLQGQQLEVFKERLNEIDNKIKEIKDDASNYTDENVQVIDKDIKQIESLVNSFKEINNSEDKINSLIQKLKDSKNNIEHRGAVAQPVVNNINSEMSALEELKRSGQNLNVGNPAEVQAFIDKLREADATVESLQQSAKDIRVSTNATASVAKLDSKFNDLLFKVDKFRRDNSKITSDKGISAQFDSLMRSIQTIEKSDVNFQRLRAQFDQLKATVQGKGLTGRSLGDELKYIAEKIGIKAMLGNSIYRVIGAFRQMVGIVTELDTGMTTLRRVTEATEKQYAQFMKNTTASAHELGSAISDVVNATGEFSKLGYTLDEATKLGEAAATYANVGFMDISSSIESMTSVMQGFKLSADEAMSVVDKMDLIGNKFSISSAGIGAALQRSASSLVAAGNDLDEAISLVTAGNTVLQDPESVANGIKIISLRIRSAKSEILELGESTDDMVESSAKLQQKVQAIAGVNIMKDDNTFKSTYQILSEIANKWSELSDIDQANCSPYVQQCA